jgi:chromosome partitioning protein
LNGLRISDGYIIPTIPDVLSTYGIPQIQQRVRLFADNLGQTIAEVGIIITKYQTQSTVHRNTVARLEGDSKMPPVFQTRIPQRNEIAASAEYVSTGTLRQKYGYQGQFDAFREMTQEFIQLVEENA